MDKFIAKPFLKWAGGKSQLLRYFDNFYPAELKEGKITRFFEPFIGSGAVFLHLAQKYNIKSFYIMDKNEDLILTYRVIQKDAQRVIKCLSRLANKYFMLNDKERRENYYKIRSDYNRKRNGINYNTYSGNWIPRAAQLIFLNKTCYNGLFRVNRKGYFNVPFGKYKKPHFFDRKNIMRISEILQGTVIELKDFSGFKRGITKNSFVYFDPPYRPISKTSSFTSYSTFNFNDFEQIRLAEFFRELNAKGVKLMLSNSDPKNTDPDDNFFDDLYNDFNIFRVPANRMINSKGGKRGRINELVITNYQSSTTT